MKIAFEFLGGPLDGIHTADEKTSAQQKFDVESWYSMTHSGTVGKRFWTAVLLRHELSGAVEGHGNEPHVYEVTERLEDGDEVIVRAKYAGTRP